MVIPKLRIKLNTPVLEIQCSKYCTESTWKHKVLKDLKIFPRFCFGPSHYIPDINLTLLFLTKKSGRFLTKRIQSWCSKLPIWNDLGHSLKSILSYRDSITHRFRLGILDSKYCYCFFGAIHVLYFISFLGMLLVLRISVFSAKVNSFILITISGGSWKNKKIALS